MLSVSECGWSGVGKGGLWWGARRAWKAICTNFCGESSGILFFVDLKKMLRSNLPTIKSIHFKCTV